MCAFKQIEVMADLSGLVRNANFFYSQEWGIGIREILTQMITKLIVFKFKVETSAIGEYIEYSFPVQRLLTFGEFIEWFY